MAARRRSIPPPTGSGTPFNAASTCINSTAGFATRYDKVAVRYEATVQITNINIWLRDLSNTA